MSSIQSDAAFGGSSEPYNAFFYGTLLHPKVLKRVIGNEGTHLQISPAILEGYTRHKVKLRDFPAIITTKASAEYFNTDSSTNTDSVRGTLVSGLTAQDMGCLEQFEGGLYTSERVEIQPLRDPVNLNDVEMETLIDANLKPPTESLDQLIPSVQALTFVWGQRIEHLKQEPWSFKDFVETKLPFWA